MREILEFIKETINAGIERLKFPLFNSFVISWLIFNWKPVFIVLFEDWPMHARVDFVSKNHSSELYTLWIPLALAFGYVLVTPFLKTIFFLALSKINNLNRKNDYRYYIGFSTERDHLAQLDYQRSVIKAGKQHADQMAQEIETLKTQYEKIENEKRLADKTIQAQNEELGNLRSEKEYTKMEAEKAALSLQSLESRNQDLLKQLSNANKSLISREDSIVVLKNENEQLKEEKNLLSTDQEAFREKIQKLFTEFDQIRGSYTALIAKVVAKFMDLKDYVPQNMAEKFDDTTAYSDERLRILNADYRDFLARKNQSFKNG